MLNKICIKPQKGCQGLSNDRIVSAFISIFCEKPKIRTEGRNIIINTHIELKEKRVRRFADKLGSYTNFKGKDNSYSFNL